MPSLPEGAGCEWNALHYTRAIGMASCRFLETVERGGVPVPLQRCHEHGVVLMFQAKWRSKFRVESNLTNVGEMRGILDWGMF